MAISKSQKLTHIEIYYNYMNKLPHITNSGFTYLSKLRNLKTIEVIKIEEGEPEAELGYMRFLRNNHTVKQEFAGFNTLGKRNQRNLFIMKTISRLVKDERQAGGLFGTHHYGNGNGRRRDIE